MRHLPAPYGRRSDYPYRLGRRSTDPTLDRLLRLCVALVLINIAQLLGVAADLLEVTLK